MPMVLTAVRLMLPKLLNIESDLSLRILPGENRLIFLQSLFLAKMGMNCWSVSIIKSHISSAMMSTMTVVMRCLKNVTVQTVHTWQNANHVYAKTMR